MQGVKEDFQSPTGLADRFDRLLDKLDSVVGEAITNLERSTKRNSGQSAHGDPESVVQKLDNSVFRLHNWASDLGYQRDVLKSESLEMRSMNTHDVLLIVEAYQMSVVEGLHDIFSQMERKLVTLSESARSMSWDSGEE